MARSTIHQIHLMRKPDSGLGLAIIIHAFVTLLQCVLPGAVLEDSSEAAAGAEGSGSLSDCGR